MDVVRGSCLCGGIKFEITGSMVRPLNCHCTFCRKQQGAAFRSRARVRRSDFKWVQGEELVTYYEATPGYRRGFCRVCGSPILNYATPRSPLAQAHPASLEEFGIRWPFWTTTPACGRKAMFSYAARLRGTKSPTTCRNIRSTRHQAEATFAPMRREQATRGRQVRFGNRRVENHMIAVPIYRRKP